jgi:hypothetical protein
MSAKGAIVSLLVLSMAAAAGLSACDRGGHQGARAALDTARLGAKADRFGDRENRRNASDRATPKYSDGSPTWASNRKNTASEASERQFNRNGQDFGASSAQDYVAKVHAFVDHPPKGVQTAVRTNGDKLFYDARSNTFAVVKRDGAPRTMFKPRDGATYWAEQQQHLSDRGGYRNGGRERKNRDRDGGGGRDRDSQRDDDNG